MPAFKGNNMNPTVINIHRKFTKLSWKVLWEVESLTPLLLLGRPQALPPSVSFIGTTRPWLVGRQLPLVAAGCTPFRRYCLKLGEMVICDAWSPRAEVAKLFRLPLGSCPSFVMDGLAYSTGDALAIYTALLGSFPDAAEMLVRLREDERWRKPRAAGPAPSPLDSERSLTEEQKRELAGRLLARKYIGFELYGGFYEKWRDARESYLGDAEAPEGDLMDEDAFQTLLTMLTKNCRRCE